MFNASTLNVAAAAVTNKKGSTGNSRADKVMSTTNRTHRCRAWSALADLAGLFRILRDAGRLTTGRNSTTCAAPDPSGAPSIGRRFDSAFRHLLLGCPEVVGFGRNAGSAGDRRRLRRTFFGRV